MKIGLATGVRQIPVILGGLVLVSSPPFDPAEVPGWTGDRAARRVTAAGGL